MKKILISLAVITLLFSACSSPEPEMEELNGKAEETPAEETTVETEESTEVNEITIQGNEFSYSPSSITITEGETVVINFENIGSAPHNLTIEDLDISTSTISGGETDTIEFKAPDTGTYTIYCSVGSHRELGMEGEIHVE